MVGRASAISIAFWGLVILIGGAGFRLWNGVGSGWDWGFVCIGLGFRLPFLRTKRHRRRTLCISRELSCILPTLPNYSIATNDCVGRWESAAPFAAHFFIAAPSLLWR